MPLRSTSGDLPPGAGLLELPTWRGLGLAKSALPCCSCRPAYRRAEGSRWSLGVLLGSCRSKNELSAVLWPALSACRAGDGSEEARSRVSGCLSAAVRECWPGCLATDCRTEGVKVICFLASGPPARQNRRQRSIKLSVCTGLEVVSSHYLWTVHSSQEPWRMAVGEVNIVD